MVNLFQSWTKIPGKSRFFASHQEHLFVPPFLNEDLSYYSDPFCEPGPCIARAGIPVSRVGHGTIYNVQSKLYPYDLRNSTRSSIVQL